MKSPWGAKLLIASTITFSGGMASAAPQPNQPKDNPRVERICVGIMGLQGGTVQHDACVESLRTSDLARQFRNAFSAARAICLKPGTVSGDALTKCEEDATESRFAASRASIPSLADLPETTTSYFRMTPEENLRRERQSCIALGLEPAGGLFEGCVANLNASLTQFMSAGFQGGG